MVRYGATGRLLSPLWFGGQARPFLYFLIESLDRKERMTQNRTQIKQMGKMY